MRFFQNTPWMIIVGSMLAVGCSPKGQGNSAADQAQWKPLDLGPQELEMVFVRWLRSTNLLVIRTGQDYITAAELELLRKQGMTGELIARGVFRRGDGDKRARVLVVMETNVTKPIELKQPDGTNAVYLQTGNSFLLLPTNTPTISKSLKIERYDQPMEGDTTHYWIDMGAVLQGGTAIIWGKKKAEK